ncbi:MAG TPA: hypothetical protein VFU04_05105, partial [Solirubrobacterales bacterium]|nr:hypothetical protein [Solirubrobacterales bacterium]
MPADVQQAWSDYQESIASLYGQSPKTLIAMERAEISEEPSDEAINTALERSEALGIAIQKNLDEPGVEQRELAILQLSATAVVDLSVAHDLAVGASASESSPRSQFAGGVAEATEMAPGDQSALTNELAGVAAILEAPPAKGIWAAIVAGGAPDGAANSREALEAAVDSALADVCTEAAEAGSKTFGGLIKLPGTELADAAGKAVAAVFGAI